VDALDFNSIRVFLRVVERGSFTAAAAQLGLPLTSASRRVRALEARLGVQLLYRTTRRIRVTEAGRDYYERCVRAEALLEEADQAVRARHAEPQGTLRVLTSYAPGLIVLEPTLAEFRRRFPKVQLALTYDNHPLDLIEGGFDVALRTGPLPSTVGYAARSLGWSRAKLVASRAYLDRHGRPAAPQDLAGHTILAIGDGAPLVTWRLTNEAGAVTEVVLRPALISNESATVIRQVVNGAGIALVSSQLMARRLAEGELEIVLPGWHRAQDAELNVLFPKKATRDPKVRAFVDFLREVFASWSQRDELQAAGDNSD
jgi:DNA-binding transcriptional LysR family regulator